MNKQKGFTLIELLVVIAIIGLLATLAVVSLNSARSKARDARRVSDIKQIQTALELSYNDNNVYPAATAGGTPNLTPTYMVIVPVPPLPSDSSATGCGGAVYTYATQTNASSYTLQYCLGNATGGVAAGLHTATPGGLANP
jgi:prepilin-type N-terminal cleavage/methylation domain-containing protein